MLNRVRAITGLYFRMCAAFAVAAVLAGPSLAQEGDGAARVFVELDRTEGVAGVTVAATVYLDLADGNTSETIGFNAIGASLAWMDGAFNWNVITDDGMAPLTGSVNLAAEDIDVAEGAQPNFEVLQEVDEVGMGVFFESDATSSRITVTLVKTDFSTAEEQIFECTYDDVDPLRDCNRFPIFRATLEVAPPADPAGPMMDLDVMVEAVAAAQSPQPTDDLGDSREVESVDMAFQMQPSGEGSELTVTSADTAGTVLSAAASNVAALTVARSNPTNPGADFTEDVRPAEIVWTLTSASGGFSELVSGITFTMDYADSTVAVDNGTPQSDGSGGMVTTVTFTYAYADDSALTIAANTDITLTMTALLDPAVSGIVDNAEYTITLASFTPNIGIPDREVPDEPGTFQLEVEATQLVWTVLDLGTIEADAPVDLELNVLDAAGNFELDVPPSNSDFTDLAVDLVGSNAGIPTIENVPTFAAGVLSFTWSHWPVSDGQSFSIDATLRALSTSAPATGMTNATADELRVTDTQVSRSVEGTPTDFENLQTGTTNAVTFTFEAVDCVDASARRAAACVIDTDVAESAVALTASFNWGDGITSLDVAGTAATIDTPVTLTAVDFTAGMATASAGLLTPVLATEDEANIMVILTATGSNSPLDSALAGMTALTVDTGAPAINLDVTGNGGGVNVSDVTAIFRRVALPRLDADTVATGLARQLGVGVTAQDVFNSIDELVAQDALDVTGNGGGVNVSDVTALFRRVALPRLDADTVATGLARQLGVGVTAQDVFNSIDELVRISDGL